MMCSTVFHTLKSHATPGSKATREDTLNGPPIPVRESFDRHANLLESQQEETIFGKLWLPSLPGGEVIVEHFLTGSACKVIQDPVTKGSVNTQDPNLGKRYVHLIQVGSEGVEQMLVLTNPLKHFMNGCPCYKTVVQLAGDGRFLWYWDNPVCNTEEISDNSNFSLSWTKCEF